MKKVWPIKLTENAEAAMLLAEEEARAANLTYVGAEHILIALVRVQSGISARAVKELGRRSSRSVTPWQLVSGISSTRRAR